MKKYYLLQFAFLTLLLFSQCQSDAESLPDISDIDVVSDVDRFEAAFFSLNDLPVDKIPAELNALRETYPLFLDFYLESLMELYTAEESEEIKLSKTLKFINDEKVLEIVDSVKMHFPNLVELESELNEAFRYYHYYFPDRRTPHFISYVGGFGPAALTLDSVVLGINLDMYLGRDLKFYDFVGFPKYQSQYFEPEYMSINMMKVLGQELVQENPRKNKMIDQMVRNGKILYFLDKVLPEVDDARKISYSQDQIDWCQENEGDVWAFFISNNLLFSTKRQQYSKYVIEGPTSSGMPPDSPGNIGSWLGWQIVKRFAKNNPDYSLGEILELEDGEETLRKSKYKPRK